MTKVIDLWQTFRTLALVDGFKNPDPAHDARSALDYYGKVFKFEPSYRPEFDMKIVKVVDLSGGGKHPATLSGVLDAMLGANEHSGGHSFNTYLLVAHGHPDGFVMKVDPRSNIQANPPYVRILTAAANVVRSRDLILKFIDKKSQLKDLQNLIRTLTRGPQEAEIKALKTVDEAKKMIDDWLKEQTSIQQDNVKDGPATIPLDRFLAILDKRNKFADSKAGFRRLEIRACNMGGSSEALKTYAEFFAVMEITAPLVFTMFTVVNPNKYTPKQFVVWKKIRAPTLVANSSDQHPDDRTRILVAQGPVGKTPKASPTLKYALKFQDVGGTSQIELAISDDAAAQEFVQKYISPTANYKSGRFPLIGFDALHERTSQPAEANGKGFILPVDPEYRALIKNLMNIGPIPINPTPTIGPF